MKATLKRWADAAARQFGYEAVIPSKNRRPLSDKLQSEDAELNQQNRRKLIAGARDLERNFSIAAWMIRCHLNYTSRFNFRSACLTDRADVVLEKRLSEWSLADACDITGRHNLPNLIRQCEARRTVDGDLLVVKLASGHIQLIESDRIRNRDNLPNSESLVGGVKIDAAGRAQSFQVHRRTGTNKFEFDREVPAANALHHAYWIRYDQIRGVSPLAASLDPFRDIAEASAYARTRMKLSQIFGIAFYTDDPPTESDQEFDFAAGPVQMEMRTGEKAEFLESAQPSQEFQNFVNGSLAAALKALDIPFSFYDESFTTYSGARQALLQYFDSAAIRRNDNRVLLDNLTRWRLQLWDLDNELDGVPVEEFAWQWLPSGMNWIDPLKEVQARAAAIAAGLDSRQRICQEYGLDFWQIVEQLQEEAVALGLDRIVDSPVAAVDPNAAPADPTPDVSGKEQRRARQQSKGKPWQPQALKA